MQKKQYLAIPALDDGFVNNLSWATSALKAFSDLHSVHPVDIIESALWDTEALAIALLPSTDRPPIVVRLVSPFPVVERINNWAVPKNIADFFKCSERALINSADAVVSISESIANTIEFEYGLVRDDNWTKIYCGVTYWPSFDVNSDYSQFNDFDNIPASVFESSKMVVFIGRLEKRKGIDLILDAAPIFLASDPDTQLLIAGNDIENWQAITKQRVESNIFNRIHFLGEISDSTRDKLLSKAYCLLYPSRYESFGLVPLEAFVHGVPVIASNSGAIPEVVIDGVSGYIFDPYDSESLAQTVVMLLVNPLLRSVMSLNAKKRVKELSSRNMAIESVNLYARLILKERLDG